MSDDIQQTESYAILPVLSLEQAADRYNAIVTYVQELMKPEIDYGVIPGTSKPTLLKPGAEKLCTLFGLSSRLQIIEKEEDWNGEWHGGEPFFYYLYRCQLWRGRVLVAEADGSCNSREKKYRWRHADRTCPNCGQATIIKGREEYGGGWLCFVKKGGCGAKFQDGDAAIEEQVAGVIANPDIADTVNTIQKMAQKRALIAATLLAVNASEFFTQDLEDISLVQLNPAGPPTALEPDSFLLRKILAAYRRLYPDSNQSDERVLDMLFARSNDGETTRTMEAAVRVLEKLEEHREQGADQTGKPSGRNGAGNRKKDPSG